jgi:hypothetical protein
VNATDIGSLAVSAAGVVTGLVTLVTMRRFGLALAAAVELWTAAGLLRLSADGAWGAVATAATIIVIRRIVGSAIKERAAPKGARA